MTQRQSVVVLSLLGLLVAACASDPAQPPVDASSSLPSDAGKDTTGGGHEDVEGAEEGGLPIEDALTIADGDVSQPRDAPESVDAPDADVSQPRDAPESVDAPDAIDVPTDRVVVSDRQDVDVCSGITHEPVSHRPQPIACPPEGGLPDAGQYACTSDDDCAGTSACMCEPTWRGQDRYPPRICISGGNCRVDADCGPGGYCSLSLIPGSQVLPDGGAGYGTQLANGYFCHTSRDCCLDTAECAPRGWPEDTCLFDRSLAAWRCAGGP